MFNRDNAIGFLLLGFCAVVAGIMIWYIAIGETPSVDVPPAVSFAIGIVFIGLMIYGFLQSSLGRRLRGGPAFCRSAGRVPSQLEFAHPGSPARMQRKQPATPPLLGRPA